MSGMPYAFEFTALDTEDLDRAAAGEQFDVSAVSVAALPPLLTSHLLLSSGASVGRRYGPKLVVRRSAETALRRDAVVGIPGERTTAALLVRRLIPEAKMKFIPLTPYRAVFDALRTGEVDAAVLIHEGQLVYEQFGCSLVEDLGEHWFRETRLPLPVGVNVIHRRLGEHAPAIAALLRESVRRALDCREIILPELVALDARQGGKLGSADEIRRYLSLYANVDSYDLAPDAIEGIERLLGIRLAGQIL
jgi:1,4-dihydroxy-6-naphthoate synthase